MAADPSLPHGFSPECMIETAEGPVAMKDTPNKGFAVLTRLPSGQLGFRQLIKVTTAGPLPLVRVVLETGHAVVVAPGQLFYRHGMETVPAVSLAPGDRLETPFHYPAGYAPPDRDPRAPYFGRRRARRRAGGGR
jgi:hypothetical protein